VKKYIGLLILVVVLFPAIAYAGDLFQAEPSADDLLSAAGVAALTGLVIGIVKPILKSSMGEESKWYVSVLYVLTFAIALGLSALGAGLVGWTYENVVRQLLVAIVASTSAIGGYSILTGREPRGR